MLVTTLVLSAALAWTPPDPGAAARLAQAVSLRDREMSPVRIDLHLPSDSNRAAVLVLDPRTRAHMLVVPWGLFMRSTDGLALYAPPPFLTFKPAHPPDKPAPDFDVDTPVDAFTPHLLIAHLARGGPGIDRVEDDTDGGFLVHTSFVQGIRTFPIDGEWAAYGNTRWPGVYHIDPRLRLTRLEYPGRKEAITFTYHPEPIGGVWIYNTIDQFIVESHTPINDPAWSSPNQVTRIARSVQRVAATSRISVPGHAGIVGPGEGGGASSEIPPSPFIPGTSWRWPLVGAGFALVLIGVVFIFSRRST